MINYYEELALEQSATLEAIEKDLVKTQRRMIQRTNSPDLEKRTEAERKLVLVEEAKEIFLDEEKRSVYDEELQHALSQQQAQTQAQPFQAVEIEEVDTYVQHIRALIDEQAYPKAIRVATEASQHYPNEADIWFLLGLSYAYFKDEARAIGYYEEAIAQNENSYAAMYNIGLIYKKRGETNLAIRYYNQALQVYPEYEFALAAMTRIMLEIDNIEAAYKHGQKLVEVNSSQENKDLLSGVYYQDASNGLPKDHTGQGWFYEEENITRFIELTEKAAELSPQDRYVNDLKNARKSMKKTFDWSKITLLTIPLFLMDTPFIALLLAGVIIYFSIRPKWEITRRETHGQKTTFDRVAGMYTKTIGFVIVLFISFIAGMLGAAFNTDRYT